MTVSATVARALAPPALPLQLDGETIAVYALGSVALLALLFFGVKFAAGAREYLILKRGEGDPAAEGDAGDGPNGEGGAEDGPNDESDDGTGPNGESDVDAATDDADRP